MKRYYMELVIREEFSALGVCASLGEKTVKHNVTCESELEARRSALNRAYRMGVLVSRFLSVRCEVK